ncbi:MAG: hypothetical protein M1834_006122 [Cirrosporium novae-zelandiae]|nr:MAG: hypothetical protein M1834_006122 [Cirrosporium novae-zelandiae]
MAPVTSRGGSIESQQTAEISTTGRGSLDNMVCGVKTLVEGIQRLRHMGVEDLVLPLPKIVVVGDQSTGKSSLIEGISEIKVPRSSGCCTRCPLEINLTEDNDPESSWKCIITLSKKYAYDGPEHMTRRGARDYPRLTRVRPYGPWVMQDQEDFQFCSLTSKEQVQDALHWAQLANLNPAKHHQVFVPGFNENTTPDEMQVKFSPNVVRLEISGPGLPNLSFYDLPGVIAVPEIDHEAYLVGVVKNLVKEYIKSENCINLLTLPMNADAATSAAAGILKMASAQERTIGVLTKPDRVQIGMGESFDEWKNILEGKKFSVGHGYYVIKNNPDPKIEHGQARKEELDFFEGEPWITDLLSFKDRFGTVQLQTKLSQLLTDQIKACLPEIKNKVEEKLGDVEAELATLPEPHGNQPMLLLRQLTSFEQDLKTHFNGGSEDFPLQKQWIDLATSFRDGLMSSRPAFTMRDATEKVRSQSPTARSMEDAILIDDDESDHKPHGNKRKLANSNTPHTPRKRVMKTFDGEWIIETKESFTLAKIRSVNKEVHTTGIQTAVNDKALEKISKLSICHWKKVGEEFINLTGKILKNILLNQLSETFGRYKGTPLYTESEKTTERFLNNALKEQLEYTASHFEMEYSKPMTMNRKYLIQVKEENKAQLVAKRLEIRREVAVVRSPNKADRTPKLADALLGPDPFADEVDAMAAMIDLEAYISQNIRAYYECACSRFVDTICQGIQIQLFEKIRDKLPKTLEDMFGIMKPDANERCARLMAEDEEKEFRRCQLKKEQQTLKEAQEWISTVHDGY